MKIKLIVLLLFLSVFVGCKNQQKLNRQTEINGHKSTPKEVFYLETTRCYGTCPAYKVAIFDNDSLVYEGIKFVKKEGIMTKKLPKGTVKGLIEQFRGASFFKFQNQYTANISDFPTTYISFSDQGKTKKIMDYHNAPESLKKLEKLISNLVIDEVTEK
ncbi:MAG: DUF6438 domain-containing protein [Bacteroidota bacterium]